jgi:hypothetical protein
VHCGYIKIERGDEVSKNRKKKGTMGFNKV